jgi:hypothetical protein
MMGKKKTAMKRGGSVKKRAGGGSMVKKRAGGGSVKKVAKKRGGGSMVKKKAKGGPINQHKAMAMGMMNGGTVKKRAKGSGRTGEQMFSRGYGVGEKSKRTPTMLMDRGPSGMKKGGRVGKKEQGFKDRKDESIAMRVKKKRTKKQLRASANESYGKFGSKARKSGKINK